MDKKCRQYEGLFTFGDEERLMKHLETCEDCRKEHERMQKVSSLIAEVAPQLREKRRNTAKIKLACVSFAIIFFVATLGVINFNTDIHDTLMYGQTMTTEDYGLPVDSYGLIVVN